MKISTWLTFLNITVSISIIALIVTILFDIILGFSPDTRSACFGYTAAITGAIIATSYNIRKENDNDR